MLDAPVRRAIAPTLDRVAATLDRAGVRATTVTLIGWLVGVGACVAVATENWWVALGLWIVNRVLDGLDGPIARRSGATDLGGFLDIVADFSIYGGFVVAVAIAVPEAQLACVVLLLAYYLNGTAFLALSSALEKRRATDAQDGRTFRFVGGLAEGTETVVAYILFCLLPDHAETIAWTFAVIVAITALQRLIEGVSVLRRPSPSISATHKEHAS